jgi:serine/threonine-protein kinase
MLLALVPILRRRRLVPVSTGATVGHVGSTSASPSRLVLPRMDAPAFQPFTLGAYRCTGPLGEGGMGIVYRADHLKLGRSCAVKVLSPSSGLEGAALELFRREAQMAARISHPNVVTIYDFGEAPNSLFYLAMELVDGVSLYGLRHPLSVDRVVELTRQLCEGLDAAHSAGVVHRDLKPSNILLSRDHRGRDLVKILDFGLARPAGLSDRSLMEGYIIGTPEWMSPEQARGEKNLTPRSDIYALGLIVYSLLTGHKAYAEPDNTPLQVVFKRARIQVPPVLPSMLRRALPAQIDAAIFMALDPDPQKRPSSAGEFYARLAL